MVLIVLLIAGVDPDLLIETAQSLDAILKAVGGGAERAITPVLALSGAAVTAGAIGFSIAASRADKHKSPDDREPGERLEEAFGIIFEMAMVVLILAVIVKVMPSSNWQGAVGGALLLLALALGAFVVVTVRGLRNFLQWVRSEDVVAESRRYDEGGGAELGASATIEEESGASARS